MDFDLSGPGCHRSAGTTKRANRRGRNPCLPPPLLPSPPPSSPPQHHLQQPPWRPPPPPRDSSFSRPALIRSVTDFPSKREIIDASSELSYSMPPDIKIFSTSSAVGCSLPPRCAMAYAATYFIPMVG